MSAKPEGDAESFAMVVQRLKDHQKSSQGAPAYSRFVNRPAGRVIAAAAYGLGMTPNQVTGVSGLLSLGGILVVALAPHGAASAVAAAVLLTAGYAFDSADGQLARLRGSGSPAGEWLDHVVDCAKITSLHLAVLIGLDRADGGPWGVALPLAYLLIANLFFFSYVLTDQLKRQAAAARADTGTAVAAPGRASVLRSLLVVPTDYGLLCVAFLLWASTPLFLLAYGLLLLGNAGYLALGLPKWYRDILHGAAVGR